MNKKYMFGFLFFAMATLATAGIINYYGSVEQDISIELPITVDGETIKTITGFGGGVYPGSDILITNNAPFEVETTIKNDAPEGVDVDYVGTLELSKKDVVFGDSQWILVGELIYAEYTVVGNDFNAEATSPIDGYELVYYKDNSNRFNNPATAIAISDIEGNLPYTEDGNADEYDMCVIEGYSNCNGAKIWYVPSDAVTEGIIDWARASEFYFETNLVQYNAQGDVTMYPESNLIVKPVYSLDENFAGEKLVTTTIE